MTIREHTPGMVCWQVNVKATGQHPSEEGWPHHATDLEAYTELAEWAKDGTYLASELRVERSFATPCVGIWCDGACGCDDPFDGNGDGWTHLDPVNLVGVALAEFDWLELDGMHYCTECRDTGEQRILAAIDETRRPGPGQLELL